MSFTINSVVFKVFLPILVGLAIFATLDSIKVESLDPQVDSLDDAISSYNREIVLAQTDEDNNYNKDKARGKLREAVILNLMTSQHCGLTLKPEEAEVIRNQEDFSSDLLETIKNIADPDSSESGSAKIFFPINYQNKEPYEILRGDDVGITCAGADQLSSNIPGASAITENEGNDMEGRYGRIGFEVDGNFTVEDTRAAGFSFPNLGEEGSEGVYTNLLTGRDILTFAPEGCGDSEFYDSKVKMENVPLIVEGKNTGDLCDETGLAFNDVEIDYLMCEGAEGYIQTNVGGQSGEQTLEGGDRGGAYYFNYVESVSDVSASLLPFQVPDFIRDSSDSVRGFIEDQVVDVDLNPKVVITGGENNCIESDSGGKDIVVDDSQVIGPAIDFDEDGTRETCEFDNIDSYGNREYEWKGLNVKCGLSQITQENGENVEYYNTVWYETGGSLEGDVTTANTVYNLEQENEEGRTYNLFDDSLALIPEGENAEVSYDLENEYSNLQISYAGRGDSELRLEGEEDLAFRTSTQPSEGSELVRYRASIYLDDEKVAEKELEFRAEDSVEKRIQSEEESNNLEFDVDNSIEVNSEENEVSWELSNTNTQISVEENIDISEFEEVNLESETQGLRDAPIILVQKVDVR